MKKGRFLVYFWLILILVTTLTSCGKSMLLLNSSGIATYNRYTGQIEVLWENKSPGVVVVHDTVYVKVDNDSAKFIR